MAKLFDRMMSLVGLEEEEFVEELDEQVIEQPITHNVHNNILSKKNHQKVVNIHSQGQFKVVIIQPESFDQAREICEHLKNKKPVILNVEDLEKANAQRIIDFLSGAVYALNGNIQKVSNGIFLVAPNNVDIMGGFKGDKKEMLQWTK